jgi:hypothetical protein
LRGRRLSPVALFFRREKRQDVIYSHLCCSALAACDKYKNCGCNKLSQILRLLSYSLRNLHTVSVVRKCRVVGVSDITQRKWRAASRWPALDEGFFHHFTRANAPSEIFPMEDGILKILPICQVIRRSLQFRETAIRVMYCEKAFPIIY